MDVGTTKAEVLDTLAAEHRAWQALLDAIGEDRMGWAGAAGPDWTVKDVIAHLTLWRARTAARLRAGLEHTEPAPAPWPSTWDANDEDGVARINDWGFAAARAQSLAAVLAESEATWQQLAALVQALPEADLLEPGRFAWMGGAPLAATLGHALEHMHEHIHMLAIQAWQALRRPPESQ